MKKIILIITLIITYSCKSQNVVESNTLTINGVNVLGKDKSVLISNFGQPDNIEKSFSEMDDLNMEVYKYNGLIVYLVENRIDNFEIVNNSFKLTSNNITIGSNIDTLENIYPISYSKLHSKHLSIQIKDRDMYVSFHYDDITNKIKLIRVGNY